MDEGAFSPRAQEAANRKQVTGLRKLIIMRKEIVWSKPSEDYEIFAFFGRKLGQAISLAIPILMVYTLGICRVKLEKPAKIENLPNQDSVAMVTQQSAISALSQ